MSKNRMFTDKLEMREITVALQEKLKTFDSKYPKITQNIRESVYCRSGLRMDDLTDLIAVLLDVLE